MLRKIQLGSMIAIASAFITAQAYAGANHSKDHSFGEPGHAEDVTRTVTVEAHDANGEMKFVHEPLKIKLGETIKFVVTNRGEMPHEFSLGDSPTQRAHALMMEKMPDMKHEGDPAAVTLQPGETKEVIWTFNKPVQGSIELACQMPGHYEGGMVSKVSLVK
jgi:uncharacterized cupredoxin-like copper-binding protein